MNEAMAKAINLVTPTLIPDAAAERLVGADREHRRAEAGAAQERDPERAGHEDDEAQHTEGDVVAVAGADGEVDAESSGPGCAALHRR